MSILCVIPARYASSRLPGKPVSDICGKPMIWWVYQQAQKVKQFSDIVVATDDQRIVDVCKSHQMNVIMTSSKHPTGTDRVCEVAENIKADLYVNVQGDEPLIEPETIAKVLIPFNNKEEIDASNLMKVIKDPVAALNPSIPKVILNHDDIALFITRSASPYPKESLDYSFYQQMGIYCFTPEMLHYFSHAPRGRQEVIEGVEMLRLIESFHKVKFVQVETASIAVDTGKDLALVRRTMTALLETGEK